MNSKDGKIQVPVLEGTMTPVQEGHHYDATKRVAVPMTHLPIFRTTLAIQAGVEKKIMLKTWGGLGDQICAEPTLRWAVKTFKDIEVYLASEKPFLFKHLDFKKVYDTRDVVPHWGNFLCFDTIQPPDDSNLVWQFFSHLLTNCVDFPSMCAFRMQLPVQEREIIMKPSIAIDHYLHAVVQKPTVLVHAGRHWMTKTFPKDWWDGVLSGLVNQGLTPILIGGDTDDNRGTVDVDTSGCRDFRNKLTIEESLWLCQRATVLLTNDSAPLHMAATRNPDDKMTGNTWIGYFATCKHWDYITHWRKPFDRYPNEKLAWQWREENLSLGGMWDITNHCPNQEADVNVDKVDPEILRSWLPAPTSVVAWAKEKWETGSSNDY
jgi:hypothetical protein